MIFAVRQEGFWGSGTHHVSYLLACVRGESGAGIPGSVRMCRCLFLTTQRAPGAQAARAEHSRDCLVTASGEMNQSDLSPNSRWQVSAVSHETAEPREPGAATLQHLPWPGAAWAAPSHVAGG